MRKIVRLILIGCLVIIFLSACLWLTVFFIEWEKECPIDFPDGSGRIVFLRRITPPFISEYDRKIRLETPSFNKVARWLPTNTGGRTIIKVYWYERKNKEGPFLRLKDNFGEYLIDINRGVTKQILRINGRSFAGEIQDKQVGIAWVKDSDGNIKVYVGDNEAKEITGTLAALPGKYIGLLDETQGPLRFLSVEQ